jgi:hypothetical protein
MVRNNAGMLEATRALCVALSLAGCNDFATSDAPSQLSIPSRVAFPSVADAMQLHCGTLDCHGQVGRNMRLYGLYGLRLDPTNSPLGQLTSEAEYDATYSSIVGLEPEVMAQVVRHLAAPETLTLLQKPLGIEQHMGGLLIVDGDPLDRCIVGWLIGTFDADACTAVVQMQRPEPPSPDLDADLDAGE